MSRLLASQIYCSRLSLFPKLDKYLAFATAFEANFNCKFKTENMRFKFLKGEAKSFYFYLAQKKEQLENLSVLSLYEKGNPKNYLNVGINTFLESLHMIREKGELGQIVFKFPRISKNDLELNQLSQEEWKNFKTVVNSVKPVNFSFNNKQWRFLLSHIFFQDQGLFNNE